MDNVIPRKPVVCRYFAASGACFYGKDCQFLHSGTVTRTSISPTFPPSSVYPPLVRSNSRTADTEFLKSESPPVVQQFSTLTQSTLELSISSDPHNAGLFEVSWLNWIDLGWFNNWFIDWIRKTSAGPPITFHPRRIHYRVLKILKKTIRTRWNRRCHLIGAPHSLRHLHLHTCRLPINIWPFTPAPRVTSKIPSINSGPLSSWTKNSVRTLFNGTPSPRPASIRLCFPVTEHSYRWLEYQ